MPEEPSSVWEGVRRALGRLVGSARVRAVPPERLAASSVIAPSRGLEWPPCHAGAQGRAWQPSARVLHDQTPQASAGAGGVDLAAVATVVGVNAALRPKGVDAFLAPPLPAACAVHRLDAGSALGANTPVREAVVTLHPGGVRQVDARLAAPASRRLPMDPPMMPRPKQVPRFGRRAPGDSWRVAGARVREGMGRIADVPMTRGRRPTPSGLASVESSLPERRRLAETSGIALDDVVLLGVFPQVPVAAVRRLALEEGGAAVSLWLKPEAPAAGKPLRLATLVIGRQRSTGKMLQTVA